MASPIETVSGYGAHSRDIASALINNGYDVDFISLPWGATPKYILDRENPDETKILDRIKHPEHIKYRPDVFIQITIPNEFTPHGVYNIGITAGIESTACKPEWIEGCNKMDLIITTSTHSKQVFHDSVFTNEQGHQLAVTKPIEVLFEGVDIQKYINPDKASIQAIDEKLSGVSEQFLFLFVGHWLQGNLGHDRKDVGMLVKTFLETFKLKKNRPALLLKTSGAGFSIAERTVITDKINIIQKSIRDTGFTGKLPNIYVLNGELTDSEMAALYKHPKVKAMVSFTKGEGFGRPMLEFSLTGKPILASGWSGHLDFLQNESSVLLPGSLDKIHGSALNDYFIPDAKWFTVNYSIAMQFMDNVYEHYDVYLSRGKQQKKYSIDNFTLEKMGIKLKEILDARVSASENPPPINLPKLRKLV